LQICQEHEKKLETEKLEPQNRACQQATQHANERGIQNGGQTASMINGLPLPHIGKGEIPKPSYYALTFFPFT
jgi:hypothetical protein